MSSVKTKGSDLSDVLQITHTSIANILVEARRKFADDPDDFVTKGYGVLGGAIGSYANLFQRTKCCTRKDLEIFWSSCFTESCVRDSVEELLNIEEEWDQFLLDIDGFMEGKTSSKEKSLVTGVNVGTCPLPLTNICDNIVCPIEKHVKEIEAHIASFASLNCNIHVVSFGSREGALKWQKETACYFPLWTDTSRHLYKALDFKRSMFQVWRMATMHFYGAEIANNTELPKPYSDYVDDPLQMAGNVMFDSDGNVVFVYASQSPADRPSVEDLLQILRKTWKDRI